MLESLRLIDFKSFVDETIAFAPVTYLVGANAAGKSNVLDALRLLRALPFDGLEAALGNGANQDLGLSDDIRGGTRGIARYGTDGFAIHSRWVLDDGSRHRRVFGHQIRCSTRPAVRLREERCVDETCGAVVAGDAADSSLLHVDVLDPLLGADRLAVHLHLVQFMDVRPERMRRPSPRGHESWWSTWYRRARHRRAEARASVASFLEWASEACGSTRLHALDVVEDDEGMMVVLIDRDGRRIPGRGLSDGTLRCLGIFTGLLCAKPGTIVCLDDPAVGLDPGRARLLVELFDRAHRDRGIQVIVTTHDASLLRWLDDERLGQAVLLARHPERSSVARRVGDLPGFVEAKRSLGLDEMLATGWLEAAV